MAAIFSEAEPCTAFQPRARACGKPVPPSHGAPRHGASAPEGVLATAVVLLVVALALPVYRARVLRRSAWAIETNRDLAEEPSRFRER